MNRRRVAVLASGGGSNLQAILDYNRQLGDARAMDVVLVASDKPGAGALSRAERAGVATSVIRTMQRPDGRDLLGLLEEHRVELVALAGYLRLVPADVVRAFAGRIINVHPAPLPAFGGKGMHGEHAHAAVIGSGTTLSGATVHFVNEAYDEGPPVAHYPVQVEPGDDVHTLGARVLRAEHLLFPRVLDALARDRAVQPITHSFDHSADDDSNARALEADLFPTATAS